MSTRGLILGKFMPPHAGHQYLVDFARHYVDDLALVVGSLASEPIAGSLRFAWMQGLYPDLRVLHLQDENPQEPSEHPQFWDIWRKSLEQILPWKPDMVFASESYGQRLAEELGALFVPANLGRENVPISATAIRSDPFAHWQYLPACVRAHYAFRVCVFGPESTGKTTLATELARHLKTLMVSEYARSYLELRGGNLAASDMFAIARGQAASEDALAARCEKILVCDTDTLATPIWSEFLYEQVDPIVAQLARSRSCDLYLLCDMDMPWVADPVRYLPKDGKKFFARCQETLEKEGRPYVILRGSREERLQSALAAIDRQLEGWQGRLYW